MGRVPEIFKMLEISVGGLFPAFLGVIATGAIFPSAYAQEIPSGFNVERYATVWERNPFTLGKAAAPQLQPSVFDKLYLASWLIDGGKLGILVGNSETNEVQRIVAEPNHNNLRLVKMRLNLNPRLVEAIISDGNEVGTLKFRYDPQFVSQSPPGDGNGPAQNPVVGGSQAPSRQSQRSSLQQTMPVNQPYRIYPGRPRVHHEGGGSRQSSGTATPRLKGVLQNLTPAQ
jgi:hypothetical protein